MDFCQWTQETPLHPTRTPHHVTPSFLLTARHPGLCQLGSLRAFGSSVRALLIFAHSLSLTCPFKRVILRLLCLQCDISVPGDDKQCEFEQCSLLVFTLL